MMFIKRLFWALIIFLAIFSLSVFVVVNVSIFLYVIAIGYFHLNIISHRSSASLVKCYFFIIRYLEVPWDTHLRLIFFKASMKGLHHFKDVRHLILLNNGCMFLFNALEICKVKRLWNNCQLWQLINPLKVVFTGLLTMLALAFVDFQQFFINFHRLMFRNHDWVFSSVTDPVIKVLPMPYFGWCFLSFTLILLSLILLMIYFAERSLRESNP